MACGVRVSICVLACAAYGCGNSGDGDGGVDAATGAWHGCIAEASTSSCLPEYAACPSVFDGGCGPGDGRTFVGACGGYLVWSSPSKDTTETVYYDSAGNIVAIVNQLLTNQFCVAGPSDFVPPAGWRRRALSLTHG